MPRFVLPCLLAMSCVLPADAQSPQAITKDVPVVMTKTAYAPTPASYTGRQLMVGNGGGFTGFSTMYYLLDNGQLFSRRSQDTVYRALGKLTAADTKRAFATVETTGRIKKLRFNKPGNTYKFVGWKWGKQQYTVTWGAPGATVPATYSTFYDSFMSIIPTATRLN
ncbi:FAD-binding oxidoreductase [Spirosoma arcticum]